MMERMNNKHNSPLSFFTERGWVAGLLLLTLCWGCGSDSSDDQPSTPPQEQKGEEPEQSIFTSSDKPTWSIDWHGKQLQAPSWLEQEKDPDTNYCYMDMYVELDDEHVAYSSDADKMSVFIDGVCRCVSTRNVLIDGGMIVYLLHVQGTDADADKQMVLHYYCAQLQQDFVIDYLPPFKPNNLWDQQYEMILSMGEGCTRFPFYTEVQVNLPGNPDYKETADDLIFFFINGECRGICKSDDLYPGFRGIIYSEKANEKAEVRYYSATKKGYYTMKDLVELNDDIQNIDFKY